MSFGFFGPGMKPTSNILRFLYLSNGGMLRLIYVYQLAVIRRGLDAYDYQKNWLNAKASSTFENLDPVEAQHETDIGVQIK